MGVEDPTRFETRWWATPVPFGGLADVASLAQGGEHMCATLATQVVQCWGSNWIGQLGWGRVGRYEWMPEAVLGLPPVAPGGTAQCAATPGGSQLWCWGIGDTGETSVPPPRSIPW